MSWFLDQWKKYPSLLRAVQVSSKPALETLDGFLPGVAELEKQMNGRGRVIVRYSGTEPKFRILVEGEDSALVSHIAGEVEKLYRAKTEVLA